MMDTPLLLREVRPIGFGAADSDKPLDILIGANGRIAASGRMVAAPADARVA